MASYPPKFFLRTSERVLVDAAMAGAWALEHILATILLAVFLWGGLSLVVLLGAPANAGAWLAIIASAAVVHLALSAIYVWRRLATTEYVVTDEAVYTRRGQFLLYVAAAALDRVTDLHVRTSLVGRLFGYSSLTVRTAGGGVYLPGLRDAYALRSIIQEARHDFLTRLLRESGRTPDRAASTVSTECECPTCATVIRVPPARPVAVECPKCHETGMLFEEAAA